MTDPATPVAPEPEAAGAGATSPPEAPDVSPAAAEPGGARRDGSRRDISRRVVGALRARGPLTGHALARALDEIANENADANDGADSGHDGGSASSDSRPLAGREGSLYAVLLLLRSRGEVVTTWRELPEGRRAVHSIAGPAGSGLAADAAHAADPVLRPPAVRPTPALDEAARRSVSSLAFAPRLAEEIRVQIADHLADSRARRIAAGAAPGDAESEALADLGDPWRISKDVASAARGGRVAAFPANGWEATVGALRQDLPMIGGVLVAILFVRMFLLTAFHIPTKSMDPTFRGHPERGDRILVWKAAGAPERFDLEVFDGWGRDRKHFVKRTVGLPNEEIRFREGDLWVDGNLVRKDGADLDAMLFPQFDLAAERRCAARSGASALRERLREAWSTVTGRWTVNDDGVFEGAAGTDAAVLRFEAGTTHAFLDDETCELRGRDDIPVADARISAQVQPVDADARVALRLRRGDESAEAVLRGDDPGVAFTLDGKTVASNPAVDIPPGRASNVRFSRVDHVLRLDVDGREVLRHDLAAPLAPARDGPAGGVEIVVRSGVARVRAQKIERDVHWTTEYGEVNEGRLGPDEFFMAGDNSANSSDSRAYGPVHRSRLVGRPLVIMWPFARFGIPR